MKGRTAAGTIPENVCSKCGIAFCHDCLVYPRGPKKPPLCVPCAIAAAGVRSSARNQSNLSRREVKKRVREAKDLQQPQPYLAHHVASLPLFRVAPVVPHRRYFFCQMRSQRRMPSS